MMLDISMSPSDAQQVLIEIGDWRLDKAIQHFDQLLATMREHGVDTTLVERYQGLFLRVREILSR